MWQLGPLFDELHAAVAKARKDQMAEMLPLDAVGTYLSYNSGFDFSTLPGSFALAEVAGSIAAALRART